MINKNVILADGRWSGAHGIGRFSTEVLTRLTHTDIIRQGPKPLALRNFFWLPYHIQKQIKQHTIFFTPGFNPILHCPIPFVLTICDLIHLHIPGKAAFAKKIYYELFIKSSLHRAYKIITISEYSKKTILEWAAIPAEKVVVVGCGVSEVFQPHGVVHQPGYSYILYVGNSKPHKNIPRLLEAFAIAKIDPAIRFILTCTPLPSLLDIIKRYRLEQRVIFSHPLSETELAAYYRGAIALMFPSLYEGFGLPVLEAMASGTPVLTATTTSLPEVAGEAALMVNPNDTQSIADGIEKIVHDKNLQHQLIKTGFERIKLFSWDKTAAAVQQVLTS